jgi:hypothetical protein
MLLLPILKEYDIHFKSSGTRLVGVDVERVDTQHVDLNNLLTSLVKDVK